ncbi:MAG: polyphosphate kinase 2 [Azonexus sp.]|jgi:polyphosphate kinase 2|nr:polyphosphate kinase 2 [Azonexus sp.]
MKQKNAHPAAAGTGEASEPVKLKIRGKERIFAIDDPHLPDWIDKHALESGRFPYKHQFDRDLYEEELRRLQIELVKMQFWLKASGKRLMALFEGRDAAGKDGTISAIHQYLNPRSARAVALDKPTATEASQWYFQRYIAHFPAAGEIVLFNRSWYNRAGVEAVMGFCTPRQYENFLETTPHFEDMIVEEGILFFKFWLNIGKEMQLKRFHDRRHDPRKIWKLSPMDVAAINHWDDYTARRDAMLKATHRQRAPWLVVRANDKRRARLNVIRHLLHAVDYDGKDKAAIGRVDRKIMQPAADFLKQD